ncbi:hypothetical protein NLJ89_g8791 [Agrocybe chaxingu]|uniref:Ndc10 domain-containing protein n=1 Tax=Agrocybe chaxingu TaxID=84603 RepID=A0A9W8JTZ8_9AGAR|nr:hypothetical protein NLJ89_g8791 [Agrocybe chaxingu]
MVKRKGTKDAYERHIRDYEMFWVSFQDKAAKEDPAHRDNRGRDIEGSSIGKEHIKQVISALQRHMREHQHLPEYSGCPDTRIPLRDQDWVKLYETASAAREPDRKKKAHILKAMGTSADIYTRDELTRMSIWSFEAFGPSAHDTHLGIRDRTMLLFCTNIAFRGDSCRRLLWSDLFTRSLPMEIIGPEVELPALGFLADQAKTNTSGRVDEHALFRHRHPELCGFGALAFFFFSYFHILKKPPPEFAPDFCDVEHSEYGRRDWYGHFLFPGKMGPEGEQRPMTYTNHYERLKKMHEKNDISISKVTHGGRFYSADKAGIYGASGIDIKALGNWKTGDAYSEVYNRAMPVRAMLAASMFSAEKPDSYVLSRSLLDPPANLLRNLFPWVEGAQQAYFQRVNELGHKAIDYSLKQLLILMPQLRTILIQDAAVLFPQYPGLSVWNFPPFNTSEFRDFAKSSVLMLEQAELEAKHRLEALPEKMATSMRGIVETLEIKHTKDNEKLNNRLDYLIGLMTKQATARSKYHSQDPLAYASNSNSSCLTSIVPSRASTPSTPVVAACDDQPGASSLSASHSVPNVRVPTPAPPPVPEFWPKDLQGLQSSFILSSNDHERADQISEIYNLNAKYGDRLKSHQFTWMKYSSGRISAEWLPIYAYKANASISEIWEEYTNGLDGHLSIQQLCNGWDARWRRNQSGLKTEAARRKQVTNLIEALSRRPNWNVSLALRFLKEKYPIPSSSIPYLYSTRSFITHLQNKKTGAQSLNDIMEAASVYCSGN